MAEHEPETPHPEGPPTLRELSNALSSVTNWYTLGVKLGLESCDLNTIEQNHPRDSSRCRDEMLAFCLRSTTPPTWNMTVDALHQMEQHQLAIRIRSEHPSSFTATREPPSQAHLQGAQAQPHSLSLKEEIKQFEEKYEDLVDYVLSAFKTGGVSIKRVLKCLRQLPVSLKLQCGEFLQRQAARLCRASSIDELFFILSPHWDFLNPSLLTHLAYRFGDDQAIRSVEKYLGELREFRVRTKIDNFIDMWTGTLFPDTQEIVMKLGDNWREQTLEQLEVLRIEVSRKRCFADYVMPLKGITESSVDAVFSLPKSVDIHSLELESLREFFQEHQVLRVLLNGVCILNLQVQQLPPVTHVKSMLTEGDVEVEEQLLVPHVKPVYKSKSTDRMGKILMEAARMGSVLTVMELIQQGATVNFTDEYGCTALHLAAQEGHEDVVVLLLDAKADPELITSGIIFFSGAELEESMDRGGATALMIASFKGHSSVVRKLLQAQATVNTTNENGWTALHLAAQEGHEDVVELLLEAKADPELRTQGWTTSYYLRADPMRGDTALMLASSKGHSSMVRRLLQAGATVNTANKYGYSAVDLAACNGHKDVVELLLDLKADPEVTDEEILTCIATCKKFQETVLMAAARVGSVGMVRKMIQCGANVNLTNKGGDTALVIASSKGHSSMVRQLLQAGAIADSANKDGCTALYLAVQGGHQNVAELLLEENADPEPKPKDGDTALMIASSKGHSSMVRQLLQAGATVNTANKWRGTALYAAARYGHEDVIARGKGRPRPTE